VAYFGINFVIVDLVMAQRALEQFTRTEQRPDEIHEASPTGPPPLRFVIEHCLADFRSPPDLLSREVRIALVGRLRNEGVFVLRGAVREIVACLGISRAAVYNYEKLAPKAGATRRSGVAAGAAHARHSPKDRLP
jgi:predicted transcriptional regulator YheO